jgi:transposase
MLIIGADACKDRIVFCAIDTEQPFNPKDIITDGSYFDVATASHQGVKKILDLKPDAFAIEPTGVHYTQLWIDRMSEAGVEVVLVGHNQLKAYRTHLSLPDKDDCADALALAHYYYCYHQDPSKFVHRRDATTARLRFLALELGHLNKLQSPAINHLQQQLAWAFPEKAASTTNAQLFWRWLAGTAKSLRYDTMLAETVGSGITDDIRTEARFLCDLFAQEKKIERELLSVIEDAQFLPYRKVMAAYGFGLRTQAILISQIYPLENFLDANKQPIVEITRGKVAKHPTHKHKSLRRFTKMLGCAPVREQSGSTLNRTKKSGSELCRSALWLWLFTRIESKKTRLTNIKGQAIGRMFDDYKAAKPTKLARSTTIAKVAKMLFYDLVAELNNSI